MPGPVEKTNINQREKPLILMVDDVPKNIQVLASILTNAGYEIAGAKNAATALQVLDKVSPDLILLDVMMPEMDGFELCRKLKASAATREIPVIFLTLKAEDEAIVKGFRSGGVDYVTKPFNTAELLARVKTHLDLKRSKEELKKRAREIEEKNRKLAEQAAQLEEKSGKLKEMDKIKSRFFANISHEFRTPLTLIMGPLEQWLADCRDKRQVEEMRMMLRNSQRLLTLINQLLDLSKLESGRMILQASQQDVIPFLKGVVGSFESLVAQKELELVFQAEKESITLFYEAEKLEKIVVNLLTNAIKFTPAGGKVTVTAAECMPGNDESEQKFCGGPGGGFTKEPPGRRRQEYPNGFLELKVCDTGIGIPKDQLPYLFDRFYQVGSSNDRERRGTGIGLALVKELVELLHGEVFVQSTQGKGSEFTMRLPLGKGHLKPEEVAAGPQPASGGKGAESELANEQRAPGTQEITLRREAAKRSPTHVGPLDPPKTFIDLEDETPVKDEEETGTEEIEKEEQEKDIILVVEDNPDMRRFIRGPLEPHYNVVEAVNGREGIEKAKKIIPDLIVSDIMMTEVDGYELCERLKKDIKTSHIPIILLTAKASDESKLQGLQTGADDYITKPFNTKILLARIKNLIDLRRGLQEKIQREMVLQPSEIAVSSVDQEFMKELKDAVEKNMSDEEFGVDKLAKILLLSRATLNRKSRAITGESANQFIQSYRLKRAAQLLKANFGNVTEVSFELGFSSSAYFAKCFREKFHQTPHSYLAAKAE
jgi:DNA-binding response OmpR family regulator